MQIEVFIANRERKTAMIREQLMSGSHAEEAKAIYVAVQVLDVPGKQLLASVFNYRAAATFGP
jgi:hypothetical protein